MSWSIVIGVKVGIEESVVIKGFAVIIVVIAVVAM